MKIAANSCKARSSFVIVRSKEEIFFQKEIIMAITDKFTACGIVILLTTFSLRCAVDVTFIGPYKFADGIGRRAIGQIQTLKDTLNVNFINSRPQMSNDVDIERGTLAILRGYGPKQSGNVMVFLDTLYGLPRNELIKRCSDYKIRLAYLTIESTKAPASWVGMLNSYFDAVLVPDIFCLHALKDSGVNTPGFVMPEICYLEEFLKEPLRTHPHYPFTFGVSATALNYKNYDLLLEAFAAEFKYDSDVRLKIHNHRGDKRNRVKSKIKSLGLTNVSDTHGAINWEDYKTHMKSIDCYVLISKGEGFSITPREALALGRPCILANHTAHRTICDTGFVRAVEAKILEKHDSENYNREDVGYIFNCRLNDVRKALRDVYENYHQYLYKAYAGRKWVTQYLSDSLRARYVSMLKPKMILLGDRNEVTNDYVMTDSKVLYDKYIKYVIAPTREEFDQAPLKKGAKEMYGDL